MNSIVVKNVEVTGPGVIILTGPSGCGKGEIAKVLGGILSISQERWLSMGSILRDTFRRAAEEVSYSGLLAEKYQISDAVPVLASEDASPEIADKINRNASKVVAFLAEKRRQNAGHIPVETVSQLEWLAFCTTHGFLVPNRWTQNLIAAGIEAFPAINEKPFILDGYPRTVAAAEHLLSVLNDNDVPVIKVLHLSISKQEMLRRAQGRKRLDDTHEALLKRYEFYVESVQPSIDYLKAKLGSKAVALIDAHQPHYDERNGEAALNIEKSIRNVALSALTSLGLPATNFDFTAVRPGCSVDNPPPSKAKPT